ncbi:MAG TPA: gamma-glutamyltransferase family protein [Gemmatimonadaceae bacterium]|nr:gamma-glutamyltransferase family protein [Gemmatimonadaceae bacterium]
MIHVDPQTPLAQVRPDIMGMSAAVVSDHPLATAAGSAVLARGGNAVDAAITMAAVLTVVRPHMCGVGGDAFLLIADAASGRVHALNGSGAAGSRASAGALRARGLSSLPVYGAATVTVPGAVRAWADALARFGTASLADALVPAIRYAREGFPVTSRLMLDLEEEHDRIAADPGLRGVFLPGGDVPHAGELVRQAPLAGTLERIARDGADALYQGEIAGAILRHLGQDALITAGDLAAHASEWSVPLASPFGNAQVLTAPPNSQGIALLLQLGIAEAAGVMGMIEDADAYVTTLAEGCRLALATRDQHVADPRHSRVPVGELLDPEFLGSLASRIGARASAPRRRTGGARGATGDTVYLGVIDRAGNAVSMIQSLFHAFGTGTTVPGTGIVLHNRGSAFTLEPGMPRTLASGVRPYHTLAPVMVLAPDGSPWMVLGTPGGDAQTQTMTQVLLNRLLLGMTPQRAIDAPRWRVYGDSLFATEERMPVRIRARLHTAGFRVVARPRSGEFGGAQMIERSRATGARIAAADGRREGYAIAF